jgi:hypothetical protein
MPSTDTMMPPFFFTWASHCWSSFASRLSREPRAVRIEQVQDFPPRDRHPQRFQSPEQLLMDLIDRLVFQ